MKVYVPGRRVRLFSMLAAGLLAVALVVVLQPEQARASFPGKNGKILFASTQITDENPEGDWEIFSMKPDGSGLTQLTSNAVQDRGPTGSPDGEKIAFFSNRDPAAEGNHDIYVMDADGSDQTSVTEGSARDLFPAWSPDGRRIAFETQRDKGTFTDANSEIYAMDANGRNPINLTHDPIALDSTPAWSPNGRKIAFRSFLRDSAEETVLDDVIYTMNADGSQQTARTSGFSIDTFPLDWAPL